MLPNNAYATHLSTLKRHHSTDSIYKHTHVPWQDILRLNEIPAKLHFNNLNVTKCISSSLLITFKTCATDCHCHFFKTQQIWIEVSCKTVNRSSHNTLNAFFFITYHLQSSTEYKFSPHLPHLIKMTPVGLLLCTRWSVLNESGVSGEGFGPVDYWLVSEGSLMPQCRHYITLIAS